MTTATRDAINEAPDLTPEPPRPLQRQLAPPEPFPVEALGELAPIAEAIRARTQAPASIPAQAVLAAATGDVTLTAGGLKGAGWRRDQTAGSRPATLRQRAKAASRCRWVERA